MYYVVFSDQAMFGKIVRGDRALQHVHTRSVAFHGLSLSVSRPVPLDRAKAMIVAIQKCHERYAAEQYAEYLAS